MHLQELNKALHNQVIKNQTSIFIKKEILIDNPRVGRIICARSPVIRDIHAPMCNEILKMISNSPLCHTWVKNLPVEEITTKMMELFSSCFDIAAMDYSTFDKS